MWCIGKYLNIFYNKLQKNSFKNSFACKMFLGKKDYKGSLWLLITSFDPTDMTNLKYKSIKCFHLNGLELSMGLWKELQFG
jgi:hypothetical protein